MIYVYAVVQAPCSPVDSVRGLEDQALGITIEGPLAAVYSQHVKPVEPNPDNLWRHEHVVESLMRDATPIPARFGTTFDGIEQLRNVMSKHQSALSAGLNRVRGCVEMGVRIILPPATSSISPTFSSGRAYMTARLEEERHLRAAEESATAMLIEAHAALAALTRERAEPAFTRGTLRTAYLVPRERADAFAAAAREFASQNVDAKIICTGPWPCYHFVPALTEAHDA